MRLLCLVIVFATYAASSYAADPKSILGQWIEKFPNGAGMVTEFTAQSMESYPVDATGKRTASAGKFPVTYRDLDPSTIGVDFQGGGGGIMVMVKDANTIVLDFPGVGAHNLKRLGAASQH